MRGAERKRSGCNMQIPSVVPFLFLHDILRGGPRGRFIIVSIAPFLEFGADRARQRETKAEIRASKYCNWQRNRKRIADGQRQKEERTETLVKKRRQWIRDPPRPRASARYERVSTDPALLLLRGDPGWSPRPARTSLAIKRSDKAAMFICRDRGKKKREAVPGRRRDIPAGRARRQNNKTKDAGGGRWRSEGRKRRTAIR